MIMDVGSSEKGKKINCWIENRKWRKYKSGLYGNNTNILGIMQIANEGNHFSTEYFLFVAMFACSRWTAL